MENLEEAELSGCTASLDVRILDYFTATEKVSKYHPKTCAECTMLFSALVFPNDDDEDCLSVRVHIKFYHHRGSFEMIDFKWAVSIIDIEGKTRFTRYFVNPAIPYGNDFVTKGMSLSQIFKSYDNSKKLSKVKYLEKSFILNRADEFIFNGALLLRFDIYCDFSKIKPMLYSGEIAIGMERLTFFLSPIPQTDVYKKGAESRYTSAVMVVFDFTSEILTLPQFDEKRKSFGVYGFPPEIETYDLESKEHTTDILEDVWMFDTRTDRFLLSLAPNKNNLGRLLVDASPVIKRCVEAPMKEQREKRVKFRYVSGLTFQIVLNFLRSGEVVSQGFFMFVEVYKFSHLYQMRNLQQNCSQCITRFSETESELKKIEKLAELYSDEYLLGLLQLRKREIFPFLDAYLKDDKPNFDSFI